MSMFSGDTNRREGEDRRGPSLSTIGKSVPIPRNDRDSLLAWISYITVLHLLYLVWREASGRDPIDGRT